MPIIGQNKIFIKCENKPKERNHQMPATLNAYIVRIQRLSDIEDIVIHADGFDYGTESIVRFFNYTSDNTRDTIAIYNINKIISVTDIRKNQQNS